MRPSCSWPRKNSARGRNAELIQVASYCRVSTNKDDQANSFESQQRYFSEYIQRHPDWELYRVYADEGITGTSTQKRTKFNRMIQDACAGKFQLIITKEISRFSRNILDTITYTRQLKAIGVGVLFMTENLNTLNPESEMLLTFMGTMAQEESRRTSVRVKWGQTRQMERGVVFGPSLLGYDVKDGSISVNPEGAQLVRLIFHKYSIEKKGTSTIARELQMAGYRTFSGNPKWSASHIIKILKNEKYAGDLVQKKTITPDFLTHKKKTNYGQEALVVIRDHHEAIISRELWDLVQAELSKRNKHNRSGAGHSNRYVFSGKIKCGVCGASFVSRCKRLKDGTEVRRWSCYTALCEGCVRRLDAGGDPAGCDIGKLIRDDDAMNMLKQALCSLRLDAGSIISDVTGAAVEAIQAGEGSREDPGQLQKEISRVEKKKTGVMDARFSGEISKEEMQTLKAQYDEQLDDLRKRMEAAERRKASEADTDSLSCEIRQALISLLSGETESEGLYKNLLDHITVFKDRHVELRFLDLPLAFHYAE